MRTNMNKQITDALEKSGHCTAYTLHHYYDLGKNLPQVTIALRRAFLAGIVGRYAGDNPNAGMKGERNTVLFYHLPGLTK